MLTCPLPLQSFSATPHPINAQPLNPLPSVQFDLFSHYFLPAKTKFELMESLSFSTISAGSRPGQFFPNLPRRSPATARLAFKTNPYGWDYDGGLVDENMTVLRKRIREAKMAETNYEPPAGWTEWEKRYYMSYVSDVSSLVGLLQTLLMNTRPSIAFAMLAFVALGVPASAIMVLHQLGQASDAILRSVNVS